MFSFLWGGGSKSQPTDMDDYEEDQEPEDLDPHPSHSSQPFHNPSYPRPSHSSHPPQHSHSSHAPQHSRQTPPTSQHPSPQSSPSQPPAPHPHTHQSQYFQHPQHPEQPPHELTEEEYYQQQSEQYDAYADYNPDAQYPPPTDPSDPSAPPPSDSDSIDPAQFDLSMIPLLRATLKRKDEQLMALEEQHDRDIQQLRLKYQAMASAAPPPHHAPPIDGRPALGSSAQPEAAVIHSHPDYLSLHEQYSRLFDEYNHMQDAYATMERGQNDVLSSMREELEYDVRQSLHAQFEEARRAMEAERDGERQRWREEEEGWRRRLEALQVQATTHGSHHPHPMPGGAGDEELRGRLEEADEEVRRLNAHVASLTSAMEDERVQMAEEQAAALERADAQAEEIERLTAQAAQQQPADIQLYSHEEWEQMQAEVDRLRQRVAELEQTGGQQGGQQDAELMTQYQQHIQALEAHIDQQAQQLQSQAEAAAHNPPANSGEVEALRQQVMHLTGELAKKDGELQGVHRTVGQKLEQVKAILKKKDAEIARLQQKLAASAGGQ